MLGQEWQNMTLYTVRMWHDNVKDFTTLSGYGIILPLMELNYYDMAL